MKILNLIRLAARDLKNKWAILPIVCTVVAVFCLVVAGTTLLGIKKEKSVPYELNISPGSMIIQENKIAKIQAITGVTDITRFIPIQVDLQVGKTSTQLTLEGVDASYLANDFIRGSVFPETSVMPYVVLNKAACQQFESAADQSGFDSSAPVDWFGVQIKVQTNQDSRPIVGKICGILVNAGSDPAAYISLDSAEKLLQLAGQKQGYPGLHIRVLNKGSAQRIIDEISTLGLTIANPLSDIEQQWDETMREMIYLLIAGLICMLCAIGLLAAKKKIAKLEQHAEREMLGWIGIRNHDIAMISTVNTVLNLMIGAGIGLAVCLIYFSIR
jgi:hypothetical protein